MKRYQLIAFLVCAFLIGNAREVAAQHSLGINAGYNLDVDEFFLGGQFRYNPAALPILLNPSVESYFVDATWLQVDLNALYPFGVQNTAFTPYAGAGLGVNYVKPENQDGRTDAGLNLLFGAEWGMSRLRPFTEARMHVDGDVQVGLRGGLLIGM